MVTTLQRRCRIEGAAIVMAATAVPINHNSMATSPTSPREQHQPYSLAQRGTTRSRRVEATGLPTRQTIRTRKGKRHATISLTNTNGSPINFEMIAAAAAAQALRREAQTLLTTYAREDKENNNEIISSTTNTWRSFMPLPDGGRKRRLILQAMHACCARVMDQVNIDDNNNSTSVATASALITSRSNRTNNKCLDITTTTSTTNTKSSINDESLALDTFLLVRGPPKLIGEELTSEAPCFQLDTTTTSSNMSTSMEYTPMSHDPYITTTTSYDGDADDDEDEVFEDDDDIDIVEEISDNNRNYYQHHRHLPSPQSISLADLDDEDDYFEDEDEEDDDEDYCLARQTPRSSPTLSPSMGTTSAVTGPSWTSSRQLLGQPNSSINSNQQTLHSRSAALYLADARRDMAMTCGATRTWQARQAYSILAARARYNATLAEQPETAGVPPRDPFGYCPPCDDATRLRKITQQCAYTPCMDTPARRTRRNRESSNRWLTTAVETYMTRIGKITGPLRPRTYAQPRADVCSGSLTASPLRQSWSPEELTTNTSDMIFDHSDYTDVALDPTCSSSSSSSMVDEVEEEIDYCEAYLLNVAAATSVMEANLAVFAATTTTATTTDIFDVDAVFAEMEQFVSPMDLDLMDGSVTVKHIEDNDMTTTTTTNPSTHNSVNSGMIAIAG
jgi:hypothetical protein